MAPGKKTNIVAVLGSMALMLIVFPNHGVYGAFFFFLGLLCSYLTATLFFRKVSFEKLALVIFGIFLSYVSLIGFLLRFFRMDIAPLYFFSVFALLCAAFLFIRRRLKIRGPEIVFEWKRTAILAAIFLASFFFYIYPALPSFFSACTPGFDCTHHIEYSQSIYENKTPIAPVDVWAYYPFGLHTNVAFFSDAITSSPPDYINMFYPFMALITALCVVVTCGILLDHKVGKLYVCLLAALLLLSVYPASALIGYGFWAQIFGTFFVLLFFWVLDEYTNKTGRKTLALLSFFSIASLLAYQVLVALPVVLGMVFAILAAPHMGLKKRVLHLVVFCSAFLLIFSMNTWENYSRYLGSDTDIFANTPTGYDSQDLGYVERHTVNLESFQSFQLVYRRQLEQSGAIVFFDGPDRFGLLFILFSMFAVACTKKYDASLFFFVAVLFEMAFFRLGYDLKFVSLYYFSKTAYIMLYPLMLYSVLGMKKAVDCWGVLTGPLHWKKVASGMLAIMVLLVIAYATDLQKEGSLLFGERKQLMETSFHDDAGWPLIVFNRIDYFYALTQAREPYNYTFSDWVGGKKI